MTKLAFFDLDWTLYNGITTTDFLYLMANNGFGKTEMINKDSNQILDAYHAGKLTYNQASDQIINLGFKLMKGLDRQTILELETEFAKLSLKYFSYTRSLIRLLKENNYIAYIISAATFPPVEAVAHDLGVPYYASEAVMKGKVYTGETKMFLNGEAKSRRVKDILNRVEQPTFSLAFGDSTGDLPLLETADQGFIINPHEEEMKQIAKEKGYNLVTGETVLNEVNIYINQVHEPGL